MKTAQCRWCGKEVQVQPNQRQKPHRNGAKMCCGSGMHPEGYTHHRIKPLKNKRTIRHKTI